ncbi:MAG: RbsD or FucU transport [Bacteroidetes bacterium]|jgi:L-fucose mutarotase|nr:RbsD or FucU transport [Bacteroidota bacterium]
MLQTTLLHPGILSALGRAGHGSQVLIADGNYPFSTGSPDSAEKVFLNLMPGMVKVTDVLEALVDTIPIETAAVMVPDDQADQPIFSEFRKILPRDLKLMKITRFAFYDRARSTDTALVIATGEQRIYANILLTIGVRTSR